MSILVNKHTKVITLGLTGATLVTPAKAGVQISLSGWAPAFAGVARNLSAGVTNG